MLVDQMNVLLADEAYWSLGARMRAAAEFDSRVVNIFYDAISPPILNGKGLRDEVIPLPGREDGYATVQILGATGAGKTTLVRQLIGSHPKRDRFPSTSTAKTTVADLEVVLRDGQFEAVVSFFSKDRVELYVQECVIATRHGWPLRWTISTNDRAEFISAVNRFTSNFAPNFGRLLTPLVEGIRVRGPFRPSWYEEDQALPRLVLLDGEGLGHTSESSQSLPTSVTSKYSMADAIVLVDSATQPMLSAPAAVLRSVAATGHDAKLGVVFTHFDQVKGDNIRSVAAKRAHVERSLENALGGLESVVGSMAIRGMKRTLQNQVFFAANIHQHKFGAKPAIRCFTTAELEKLVGFIEGTITPAAPVEAQPVYDTANLVLSVAQATNKFLHSWDGRLGLLHRPRTRAEHWTRVKALTRRLAEWNQDSYDNLMPVADLTRELTEGISKFVDHPRSWEPEDAPEEMRQAAIAAVRREAARRLADLVVARLWQDPLRHWLDAYVRKGKGSGRLRNRDLWSIFNEAAPILTDVPTPEASEFLDVMRDLFRQAVDEAGGRVVH